MYERAPALILLGPTGSGKTPLGALLADRGWRGWRCVHFDFGAQLRQVAAGGRAAAGVSAADVAFVQQVLERGALLEDRDFPLAERILRSFLRAAAVDARTLVVMNGLPRHVGQAEAVESVVRAWAVVQLRCSPQTVWARIATNIGGDRTRRTDDDLAAVERKLAIYAARTAPLVAHYRAQGIPLATLEMTATVTPEQAWSQLQEQLDAPPWPIGS